MESRVVLGLRIYEFFRSEGYNKSYEDFGRVALKPPDKTEIGYVPVTIYYSQPYTERGTERLLIKEGYTLEDFWDWMKTSG